MRFNVCCLRAWEPPRPIAAIAIAGLLFFVRTSLAQRMPSTQGDTLAGTRIVLSDAVKGHPAILIAGFSHDAGDPCGVWFHDLRSDPAFKGVAVYELAEIEKAPSFVRGMIKSGMRKGVAASDQENFVVLTRDDANWRSFFQVQNDKDPYVVLLGATGEVRWRGHGKAVDLVGQLKSRLP